jgi:hypothetical protein
VDRKCLQTATSKEQTRHRGSADPCVATLVQVQWRQASAFLAAPRPSSATTRLDRARTKVEGPPRRIWLVRFPYKAYACASHCADICPVCFCFPLANELVMLTSHTRWLSRAAHLEYCLCVLSKPKQSERFYTKPLEARRQCSVEKRGQRLARVKRNDQPPRGSTLSLSNTRRAPYPASSVFP